MFAVWYRKIAPACVLVVGILFDLFMEVRNAPAQQLPPPPEIRNPSIGANLTGFFTSKTPYEFWLTCLICLFGLAVVYALLFGLRRSSNARPEEIARPIIVITVITGTLMLVTVGYNNEQIAPAFGLFGTIVGYMLGRYAQPQQISGVASEEKRPADPSQPPMGQG